MSSFGPTAEALNALLDLEELDEDESDRIRAGYTKLASGARRARLQGKEDTNRPAVDDQTGEALDHT